ncbi:SUF system Fe-S cluster assembly protein [Arenibaculum sp.]|uniref:SUF system Fe-S cluster assembly protein n=1 Tax=Arenibaculum sp. TaxID=2865862 RepID=UPI002E106E87|nr:SUF system Fe-S cluster assembly protein [Arenibaculum sp.]
MPDDLTNERTAQVDQESTAGAAQADGLRDKIVTALKTVYDPEIPVDIWELGLIYKLDVDPDGAVDIDMTVTAPACPVADELPMWVRQAVEGVEGVQACKVELVWEPTWHPGMMSEEARVELNMF